MNQASPAQLQLARRLLAHEGAATPGSCAVAAGRVYETLHAHLDPLIGAAGVQALLVRSAKLARDGFPFLMAAALENSKALGACLQAQDPAVALESAAALFATFFALLSKFIGERLTTQALRGAWPNIEAMSARETET